MIYNDTLPKQYGTFSEIGDAASISKVKPMPQAKDYEDGFISRYFLKKANEDKIFEVSYLTTQNINLNLYKVVEVKWKISGPKNNIHKANILDKAGVMEYNRFEINKIKTEHGVDLSGTLTNLLEYWRGR